MLRRIKLTEEVRDWRARLRVAMHLGPVLTPQPATAALAPACLDRRALLSRCFSAATLTLLASAGASPASAAEKKKEYVTLDDYNKRKAAEKKDEELYGKFEALRTRAYQTAEFDSLAEKDDFVEISRLALAWDSTIRKELLEAASAGLDPGDKDKGTALNKAVLKDLKGLDKLAKAGSKEEVPAASAQLRTHVLDFVALEPQRLSEKFGVSDL